MENKHMKTELTKEQSQHLIDLGIPKEKASGKISYGFAGSYPIFELDDFLNGEILPKKIEINEIDWGLFFAWDYTRKVYLVGYNNRNSFYSKELIDALYELTIWSIENKHLKL